MHAPEAKQAGDATPRRDLWLPQARDRSQPAQFIRDVAITAETCPSPSHCDGVANGEAKLRGQTTRRGLSPSSLASTLVVARSGGRERSVGALHRYRFWRDRSSRRHVTSAGSFERDAPTLAGVRSSLDGAQSTSGRKLAQLLSLLPRLSRPALSHGSRHAPPPRSPAPCTSGQAAAPRRRRLVEARRRRSPVRSPGPGRRRARRTS